MIADVDVPEQGCLRVTFRPASSGHHKNWNWFCNASYAEVLRVLGSCVYGKESSG
jgi:hypothetical protein